MSLVLGIVLVWLGGFLMGISFALRRPQLAETLRAWTANEEPHKEDE